MTNELRAHLISKLEFHATGVTAALSIAEDPDLRTILEQLKNSILADINELRYRREQQSDASWVGGPPPRQYQGWHRLGESEGERRRRGK